MATDAFDPTKPSDTTFVGEPTVGAQAELRGIKAVLVDWLARIAFKNTVNTFTKAQISAPVALTSSASITIDASAGNVFTVVLGHTTTFQNPSNPAAGQQFLLKIKQDAAGGRTYTFGSAFRFPNSVSPAPTLAANASDVLAFVYLDNLWFGTYVLNHAP